MAGVLLAMVLAVMTVTGCSSKVNASGDFTPVHPGVLTVATSDVPLAGMWEGTPDQPTGGFEYELARAMASHLGLDRVEVVIVPFDTMVAGDLGGADLALSDLTATSERAQHLDFSGVYLAATPSVLVQKGRTVTDLHTAQGLSWAVGHNTTLEAFLQDTVAPDGQITLTESEQETIQAVRDGSVDAGLLDLPIAAAEAASSDGALTVAGQFASDDSISAALPKGSPNLDAVSSSIRALTANGTIRDLAKQWLGISLTGTAAQDVPLIRTNG